MAFFERLLEASSMSSPISIRANVSKETLLKAYKIAQNFEERYSAYKKESFLTQVNTTAYKEALKCSESDMRLFEQCIELSKRSEGDFDITIGSLSHGAYHFGFENEALPSKQELSEKKKLVDYKNIVLDNGTIFLKKRGVRLDLGGIGKGYVAKLIAEFLLENGATKFLVNVGGEIVSFGKNYTIGIKDPFNPQNEIAYLQTTKEFTAISSSGNYERFIDSRENHHIIDRKSAASATRYSSMTLMQNSKNIDALDAFATALFSKDLSAIAKYAQREAMAIITIDVEGTTTINNLEAIRYKAFNFN